MSLNSNLLYNGKISDYQSCPRRFYFKHHLNLLESGEPPHFFFGRTFHKCLEEALLKGDEMHADRYLEGLDNLSHADKALLLVMKDKFFEVWNTWYERAEIISMETPLEIDLEAYPRDPALPQFYKAFIIKPDIIFKDDEGTWIGDWKTTSGYGAATARYYHEALQTKVYYYGAKIHYPDLKGTKIFVCTKKAPRCEVETIYQSEQGLKEAEDYLKCINFELTSVNHHGTFPKHHTSCINHFGNECPYVPICLKNQDFTELLNLGYFQRKSPDSHLWE